MVWELPRSDLRVHLGWRRRLWNEQQRRWGRIITRTSLAATSTVLVPKCQFGLSPSEYCFKINMARPSSPAYERFKPRAAGRVRWWKARPLLNNKEIMMNKKPFLILLIKLVFPCNMQSVTVLLVQFKLPLIFSHPALCPLRHYCYELINFLQRASKNLRALKSNWKKQRNKSRKRG